VADLLPAGAEFRLNAVQSRYGSLTIDASLSRVESGEAVVAIEKAWMRADGRSVHCCETCGQPGKPRHGEWTSPACDRHAAGVEEEPPETAVYTFNGIRYIYDADQDDVIVLTSERAASIPWLEDA
jgi:hypothetical protein